MAEVTLSTISDALKTDYLDVIRDQIDYGSCPLYREIEKNSDEIDGESIKMAIQYGVTGGVGAGTENGTLPTPNPRKFKQVTYETKNMYARFQLTIKSIKASASKKAAFVKILQMLMESTMNDAKKYYARQCYTGNSGKIGTCTAQSTVTTLKLSSSTDVAVLKDAVKYFEPGMLIDIMATDNSVKISAREVTGVNRKTGEITISGAAVTTLTTDYICVSGAYGCELTGFDDVFKDSGSLYGLDRGTYNFFAPILSDAAGEINEIILQTAIDDAEDTGSNIDFLIGSKGAVRGYQNYMAATKRNVNSKRLEGGYEVLDYNGIPLVKDKYAPYGCIFGLDKKDWVMHELSPWEWMGSEGSEGDGSVLHRVTNKPVYEGTLYKFGDLGCRKPGGQVKLYNVTEHVD